MERSEALEVLKKYQYDPEVREALECLHPELKESEDERIRKEILSYIKASGAVTNPNWIAWLEKQGEYLKFRDKIQIGDKVTRNEDGVLVNLSQLNRVAKQGEQNLANSEKTCKDEQKPAYKIKISWGDKIITDTEIEKVCNLQPGTIASLFASSQKQDCLKWSEEDNVRFTSTIQVLEFAHSLDSYNQYGKKDIRDNLTWLKSLKDRVQPYPKQEWSKEDKEALRVVTNIFEQHGVKLLCYPAFVHWLKTLPNRITFNPYWKPSDRQMEALDDAISSRDIKYDILSELYNDLKKLKG